MKRFLRRLLRILLPTEVRYFLGWKRHRADVAVVEPILMSFIGRPITVVEIGVRFGDSTRYLAHKLRIRRYWAIDPYELYSDYEDDTDAQVIAANEDRIFREARRVARIWLGPKLSFLREYSSAAAKQIEDESVDFVWVDGNHSFDYVLDDLRTYWKKIRPGGVLAGHDYHARSAENGGDHPRAMVFEAVTSFSREVGVPVEEWGKHRSGRSDSFSMRKPFGI